jgi:SAM-dependent methyltransferase
LGSQENPDARAVREAARAAAFARGETSATRLPEEGLSTSAIIAATIARIRALAPELRGDYLDVGAGNGELIDRVMRLFDVAPQACDYRDDLMTIRGVPVAVVDLNSAPLPYRDAAFDLVTCTEVIEHLENFRFALREIFRVLRPGGICVVTTPNVLNLRSRLRYLLFGFFNMFGLLRTDDARRHSTHGHINPVSYFYLAHALASCGFIEISVSIDRMQRRSLPALLLLWLPIWLFSAWSIRREREKFKTADALNLRFAAAMSRIDLLLGRTIVVGCRKPAARPI